MSYVGKVTAGGSTHLVGSTLYGTCSTAASTAAKVVTCANFDKLETGVTVHVKFDNGNTTAAPTLKVGSTTAKSIASTKHTYEVQGGSTSTVTDTPTWEAGSIVSFTYDGTNWVINDRYYVIHDYGSLTSSELNTGTSTTSRVVSAKVIADYVTSQMGDVAGALVYKGTVSAGSELLNTALKKGWYYIVDTAGSYAGTTCEPGDMIIVNTTGTYTTASALAAAVDVIQTNIDMIANSEIDTIVAS